MLERSEVQVTEDLVTQFRESKHSVSGDEDAGRIHVFADRAE